MVKSKAGDPIILDPRDAIAVSKCLVNMQPEKGIPTTRETWRPLGRNMSNPFQFDRQYLQTIELARLRTMDRQQERRVAAYAAGPPPNLAVGFTHTGDLFNPDPDGNRYVNPLSRSASSPAMATFSRTTSGVLHSTSRLTGGAGFPKNAYDQGQQSLRGTHLPGYQGFVPGFTTDNVSLGKSISRASLALGRKRDRLEDVPRPLPFAM